MRSSNLKLKIRLSLYPGPFSVVMMALAHVGINAALIAPIVAQVTVRSPGVWRDSNVVVITLIALEISLRQTASSVQRSGNIYFMSSFMSLF